jgi:putative endonuclease
MPTSPFDTAHYAQKRAIKTHRRRLAKRVAADAAQAHDGPVHRSPMQRRGDRHEDEAVALLQAAGLAVLARNLSCKSGELDLVMRDGDVLVVVEVRVRHATAHGGAAASVDSAKQRRLARAAGFLLPGLARRHWPGGMPRVRFDVVAFEEDAPLWLRNAFGVDEAGF